MYISEKEVDFAINKGYIITLSPIEGESFKKGNRNIWRIYEGYQTADLIEGLYKNHEIFYNVKDALNRPLN